MARRGKITAMPEDVQAWLKRSLVAGNFSDYEALAETLRGQGFEISKSAIHRYGQKFERRLSAIKASTEAAKLIVEGSEDDGDARSGAVVALVQTELFETILNLQEASEEDVDPGERVKLLSAAAKNVATLTRASIDLKRFQSEHRAKLLAEAGAVAAAGARAAGLSDEAAEMIRQKILGVV
ncbi:MAG: DUF3486 family protein [Pseudomonadota bacterium]|nr:DUF3486 family protein [Pseudomonadota bacterium]